jgi:hypothetical protein
MRFGFTEEQQRFRADMRQALRSAEVRAAVGDAPPAGRALIHISEPTRQARIACWGGWL